MLLMADLPANTTSGFASSAASDNATNVTAAPTRLLQLLAYNASTVVVRIKLYDKATAPTSADTPRKRIAIPAGQGVVLDMNEYFINGLGYRIVKGAADNDTAAVAVGDVTDFNLDYRT
jgi:hypothetical protein